jgi:hypothetical protein
MDKLQEINHEKVRGYVGFIETTGRETEEEGGERHPDPEKNPKAKEGGKTKKTMIYNDT